VNGDICAPGVDQVTVDVVIPPSGAFSCSCWQSLKEITMQWNGTQSVDVVAWDGDPNSSTMLETANDLPPGYTFTVGGFTGDYTVYEIYDSTGTTKLGESRFDLTCSDREMNGFEDCGKNEGNGKYNQSGYINDWLLQGLVDDDETMSCTPILVPPPPACGFGPELLLVLPGLMLAHRRRMRRA
jgi:hypothetical protein